MKRDTLPRLIQAAYDWHSGQSSPLYSFASTGGVIWSADHRDDLKREILSIKSHVRYVLFPGDTRRERDRDARRVSRLLAYVLKAKIGYCYTSGRMMPRRKGSA